MKLLYIDLFCGAGGTSTGVENARHDGRQCAKVIGCVNHDANAIASHAANHPDALHFTEDIRTLELSPLTARSMRRRMGTILRRRQTPRYSDDRQRMRECRIYHPITQRIEP